MIFNKNYFFFVAVVVLTVLVRESLANEAAIKKMITEFEKGISNKDYKIKHKGALNAIEKIKNQAKAAKKKAKEVDATEAINKVKKGYIDCIKCVAVAGDIAYKTNLKAENSSDTDAAIDHVSDGIAAAKRGIGVAGIAIYQTLGAASIIVEYAKQPLKKSIKYVTFAGQAAYSGLDMSEDLAILALESEGAGKTQGIIASNMSIEAALSTTYNKLLISSKLAFGAIDKSISAEPEEDSTSSEESPEAFAAIEAVNSTAEATANTVNDDQTLKAINILEEGFFATIKGIDSAIQPIQKVLKSAGETKGKVSKSVKEAIRGATRKAESDVAYAAANTYESLGAAKEVLGDDDDGIEEAITDVELGRAAAFKTLQSAQFIVLQGLDNGKTATDIGIKAAINAVKAGAYAAFAHLINAAKIAFEVLES